MKLKYRRYRDRKATNKDSIKYMPVHELETVGLKHADNLEELENEIWNEQFPDNVEVVDLQEATQTETQIETQPLNNSDSSATTSMTTSTAITIDDAQTFITVKDMPMEISNSVSI